MTAELVFQIANFWALSGWMALIVVAVLKRERWLDATTLLWPFSLATAYTALIIFFFFRAPGGFDSLTNVQLLFTDHWAALAGWVHYLALDLFIGCWISLQFLQRDLPRFLLIVILPMTFLFGPIGLLLYGFSKLAFDRESISA